MQTSFNTASQLRGFNYLCVIGCPDNLIPEFSCIIPSQVKHHLCITHIACYITFAVLQHYSVNKATLNWILTNLS